jgi:hypothetical protein
MSGPSTGGSLQLAFPGPNLRQRLSRRLKPFDSEDFIFALKIDGFRTLA